MEHLFVDLDKITLATKTADACNTDELIDEDVHEKTLLTPPVKPYTVWLGFDHDDPSGTEQYLSSDLATYPKLRGWSVEHMWDGDLRQGHEALKHPRVDGASVGKLVAAMLQSWLYLGFLESAIGRKVHTSYLLRWDSLGTPFIHSGNLGYALMAWRIDCLRAELEDIPAIMENVQSNIMVVAAAIQQIVRLTQPNLLESTERRWPGFADLVFEMTPSIIRLCDAITMTKDIIYEVPGTRMMTLQTLEGRGDARNARNNRLIQRGWCTFLITQSLHVFHDSVLDWVDGLGKLNPLPGHKYCTELNCVRNNVDQQTYQTSHCESGCCCDFVRPNLADVLNVLDRGMIPVIKLRSTDPFELEIVAQDPETIGTYVAFSHVWVDGLGSTTEDGLPACQIRRLAELVDAMERESPGHFWIDSLCIPSAKSQRRIAIGLLKKVYEQATSVLFIDKAIRQTAVNAPVEDLLWNIASSPWVQRLWTYQESYLAREVVFELADNHFFRLHDDYAPSEILLPPLQIVRTSLAAHLNILRPDPTIVRSERKTNIGEVATAISWRSTSKPGDEVLAIAALLSVDSAELASLPVERRMQAFYLAVQDMPQDVLFYEGPKLREAPFRWAPASLMSRSMIGLDVTADGQNARCTAQGLYGHYRVFVLTEAVILEVGAHAYFSVQGREGEGESDGGVYSIGWEGPAHTTGRVLVFSAVIIRTFRKGNHLMPDINTVVLGIAVEFQSESPAGKYGTTCSYGGLVSVLKRGNDESNEYLAKNGMLRFPTAKWGDIDLCIT